MEEPVQEQAAPKPKKKAGILSTRRNQQLFRLAFRNYIDLIGLADRKAGLLIQVNSIIISIVIGFIIRKEDITYQEYIPVAFILSGSLITIFFSVLASKPRTTNVLPGNEAKETFFFGSFDRIDAHFSSVSWEKYADDINRFFKADKNTIFEELVKESYDVRKVLSKKFVYLSIAYKVFFVELLAALLSIVMIAAMNYNG